ncbi:MAG: pitrilysin family protein [Gemmatimonadota bacterium]
MTRWTDRVRREVLPNGLTVLVQRDTSAPVASVVTHVKAGFFDEPDRWQGISHVLEHMFFKGTQRRGPGDVARETKAAGGYLNAGTGYDHTSYYVVLPASGLATAIDIQADALRNSVIDPEELARELQVIIQEANRKLDSPGSVAGETLNEVMFDRHRIRRWRIGHETTLASFTQDDVLGYYRSRYVPGRTIVSIVGDIDENVALDLAREAYGEWSGDPGVIDPSPEEPPHQEIRSRTLRGDVTHTHLAFGWRAVKPLDPDAAALDLAASILGMGRGSWLYRALRETGLVTAIGSYFYAPTELGIFEVAAEAEPERMEEVVKGIAGQISRLATTGPDTDDLDRARTLLLTRWARRLEPMDGRASAIAEAEALKHYTYLDEEYEALAAVTPSQVREVAARYLKGDAVSGLAYHPTGRGGDLNNEFIAEAFRAAPSAVSIRVPVHVGAGGRPLQATQGRRTAGVYHVALPGADLLVRTKAGVPTVTLGVYFPRGRPEPSAQAGIGALALRSAVRGAGDLDAAGLAFGFERLGGSLGVSAASDWLGLSSSVLVDRMADAAQLLRLVVDEAAMADDDIIRERHLMLEEAGQIADDMFRFPFQLAFRAAFGDRGYGLPVSGLPGTLPKIEPAMVRDFMDATTRNRAAIVAVGDVDPEKAANLLASIFGDMPAAPLKPRALSQSWAVKSQPDIEIVERNKAQSAFAMAFPGPARNDVTRYAAEVWSAVASGLGGRLFESLRSRRSLAYTVMASSWQRGGAGAILTYIACAPERETEAREEMLKELDQFRQEPASPTELSQAVSYLAGQAEVSRQSAASVAGEIVESWLIGDGLEEMDDPGEMYRRVSAADIQQVARAYLDPDVRAEGVVRGKAVK